MENQKGLGLIGILIIIGALLLTAGGVVVWEKKILPAPTTTPPEITPIPTPPPTKIIGPTVGGPVSPGVFEGDLRDLPTITPIPPGYFDCRTDADCYDEQGKPKGLCEAPCQDKAVCRNGTCFKPGFPGAICLAKNTLIDTPKGQVPVQMLHKEMSVWTTDAQGKRQLSPILKTTKTLVGRNHQMVYLILEDGRRLIASPGHPTVDGKTLDQLTPGDILDGSRVVNVKVIPYQESYTYDLLPAGETGLYWANGILLKNTLAE